MSCKAEKKMKIKPADGKQSQIPTKKFGNKGEHDPAPNGKFKSNIRKGMPHGKAAIAD